MEFSTSNMLKAPFAYMTDRLRSVYKFPSFAGKLAHELSSVLNPNRAGVLRLEGAKLWSVQTLIRAQVLTL